MANWKKRRRRGLLVSCAVVGWLYDRLLLQEGRSSPRCRVHAAQDLYGSASRTLAKPNSFAGGRKQSFLFRFQSFLSSSVFRFFCARGSSIILNSSTCSEHGALHCNDELSYEEEGG